MPAKKRTIIQLATASVSDGGETWTVLYALCNDGSVWRHDYDSGWRRVSAIPQGEE